jgi:Methyltransferase domain
MCKVCWASSDFFDQALVLGKYSVQYFRCSVCDFLQTEDPYWLEEAYSSAIAKQDVGVLHRNLLNRELTTALLTLLYPDVRRSVDFGGGHGVFVRLMRDSGFDFVWHDRHASNDYARGFEFQDGEPCDFLTAFEVLEHLADPVGELSHMMSLSQNVFVSTILVPHPTPKLSDWWYYVPSSGQHISFYSLDSLQLLAKRFGRHLLSHGAYHLFTTEPKSSSLFRLAVSPRLSRILNQVRRRPSLIESDFKLMTKA